MTQYHAEALVTMTEDSLRKCMQALPVFINGTSFNDASRYRIRTEISPEKLEAYGRHMAKFVADPSAPHSPRNLELNSIIGEFGPLSLNKIFRGFGFGQICDFGYDVSDPGMVLAGAQVYGVYVKGYNHLLKRDIYGVIITEYTLAITSQEHLYRNFMTGDLDIRAGERSGPGIRKSFAIKFKPLQSRSNGMFNLLANIGGFRITLPESDGKLKALLAPLFKHYMLLLANTIHPENYGISVKCNFPPCFLLGAAQLLVGPNLFKVNLGLRKPGELHTLLNKLAWLSSGIGNTKILCNNGDLILNIKNATSGMLLQLSLGKKVDGRGKMRVTLEEALEYAGCFKHPKTVYEIAEAHVAAMKFFDDLLQKGIDSPDTAFLKGQFIYQGESITVL